MALGSWEALSVATGASVPPGVVEIICCVLSEETTDWARDCVVRATSFACNKVMGAKGGLKSFPWLIWRRLVSPGSLLHAASNRKAGH